MLRPHTDPRSLGPLLSSSIGRRCRAGPTIARPASFPRTIAHAWAAVRPLGVETRHHRRDLGQELARQEAERAHPRAHDMTRFTV